MNNTDQLAPPGLDDLVSGPPSEAATLAQSFQRTVRSFPDKPALRSIGGSISYTWAELDAEVRSLAAGFAALGLGHGDSLAGLMQNSVECHLVEFTASHLGLVTFGIFNSSSVEQIADQIRRAEARVVATQVSFLPKLEEALTTLTDIVDHVIVVDGPANSDRLNLAEVAASGDPAFDVDASWRAVKADDLAALIYTSGTTGPPKAALLSNRSLMAHLASLDAAIPTPREGLVSFLPMAHIGGRLNGPGHAMLHGATITACPNIQELPLALADAHPDDLFAPPRFFEKLQVAFEKLVHEIPDVEVREMCRRSIDIGLRIVRARDAGNAANGDDLTDELMQEYEVGKPHLRDILALMGLDRLQVAIIGGAPCAPEISQFFRAVGLPLVEAYGATEVSLNVFNRVDEFKSGSAGKPLPGVELKLGLDGEILARSAMNFVGYRNDPEQTAAAIDADGWVHTGDIGKIDSNGFVSVVDRKKEIMINSAGKNMSPAMIETAARGESSLMGQVVAVGEGRRYVTALITLDPEALPVYADRLGLAHLRPEEAAASDEIRAEIQHAVDRANLRLNSNEMIKNFHIVPTAWIPDSDELTPTSKLRRRVIYTKYASQIDAMYQD